jgi:hypothetical protein
VDWRAATSSSYRLGAGTDSVLLGNVSVPAEILSSSPEDAAAINRWRSGTLIGYALAEAIALYGDCPRYTEQRDHTEQHRESDDLQRTPCSFHNLLVLTTPSASSSTLQAGAGEFLPAVGRGRGGHPALQHLRRSLEQEWRQPQSARSARRARNRRERLVQE